MKIQIDLKSAVLGIAVGVGVMFLTGADSSSMEKGRFQVSSGADSVAVVDTITGQIWCGRVNGGSVNPISAGFLDKKLMN